MKVKINGQYWEHFTDFRLSTDLDAVASVWSMTSYWDPNNPEHKKVFKPLQYNLMQFYNDSGALISTGTWLNHRFKSGSVSHPVQMSGYSRGGILEDVNIPVSSYPLESNNLSFRQIAKKLFTLFNLELDVYASARTEADESIEKSVASPTENIKDYLAKIACQKNVVFSHDIHGRLILFKPDPKAKSVQSFNKDNVLEMELDVNGQRLHSIITTVGQPGKSTSYDDESKQISAVDTVKNPLVTKYRPMVDMQSTGKETNTKDGAMDSLAVELKNIKIEIKLDKWYPFSIGDIVEVQNEEIYIYKSTRFMIANTTLAEDKDGQDMTITVVLPETFTGEAPPLIFD